jgi:hypothetical protein
MTSPSERIIDAYDENGYRYVNRGPGEWDMQCPCCVKDGITDMNAAKMVNDSVLGTIYFCNLRGDDPALMYKELSIEHPADFADDLDPVEVTGLAELGACWDCGERGTDMLGTRVYCDRHYKDELDEINRRLEAVEQEVPVECPPYDAADDGDGANTGKRRMKLTPASEIKVRPVHWMWEGRIPRGSLALIAGREGIGKSTLDLQLVSRWPYDELPAAQ